jgi:DCN1-like protein 1/2
MPGWNEKRKKIKEFRDVASTVPEATVTKILEQSNWNVQEALDYFYNNKHKYPEASQGNSDKLGDIFKKYADKEDSNAMGEEGMLQFFKDVSVNPEGYETLIIAWYLKSSQMGLYQKEEFIKGFTGGGCSSIADIKNIIQQQIKTITSDNTIFKEFYKWLFIHCKEDEKKKTVPTDLALQLWKIVLLPKKQQFPLLEEWLKFVESNKEKDLKSISKDVWEQLPDFLEEVKKIGDHNQDAAWPVAIDEFIEYLKEQ